MHSDWSNLIYLYKGKRVRGFFVNFLAFTNSLTYFIEYNCPHCSRGKFTFLFKIDFYIILFLHLYNFDSPIVSFLSKRNSREHGKSHKETQVYTSPRFSYSRRANDGIIFRKEILSNSLLAYRIPEEPMTE